MFKTIQFFLLRKLKIYNKAYFQYKLGRIPENEWGYGSIANHCILYHLGVKVGSRDHIGYIFTDEARALYKLLFPKTPAVDDFRREITLYTLNDMRMNGQRNPKKNILDALDKV